jgi:hypothetical protein
MLGVAKNKSMYQGFSPPPPPKKPLHMSIAGCYQGLRRLD